MNYLRSLFLTILLTFLGLGLVDQAYAVTQVYDLIDVRDDYFIKLSDGKEYYLDGIKIKNTSYKEAKEYILSVTKKSKVILERTTNFIGESPKVIVYVWGNEELNKRDGSEALFKAYLDVRVGFWKKLQEGVAVNLNELLIKKGFADRWNS